MELPEIQKNIDGLQPVQQRELLDWLQARQPKPTIHPAPERTAPERTARERQPSTLRSAVLWTVLSLAAFFLVDAAIFRSGWYFSYVEPRSTTGQLELHMFWVRHTLPAKVPEVAVVGDSRIAEGFAARMAASVVQNRLVFWNLGVAGSSPRTWYYLLRDTDPTRRRFASIAFALDRYSDQDRGEDLSDRISDLNYAIGRLRLSDCIDFSQSYNSPELRRGVLTGCLFKAVTLRRDIQDLIRNPADRFKDAKNWRNDGHGYVDGYGGLPQTLTGLRIDFVKGKVLNYPPGLDETRRNAVKNFAHPVNVPQTGAQTAYRKLWLGRILDLYKHSPITLVFFELPGGPLPPPPLTVPARFLNSVANRPRVTMLPPELFGDLEHPEVYADTLHLNQAGRPIFSERLALKLAEIAGVQ
jgi:hypothetical protein